jgi:hypothetical protein
MTTNEIQKAALTAEAIDAAHLHNGCPGWAQDWLTAFDPLDAGTLSNLADIEARDRWCANCMVSGRDGGEYRRTLEAAGIDVEALLQDDQPSSQGMTTADPFRGSSDHDAA